MKDKSLLELKGVWKTFQERGAPLHILQGIDLTVQPGEIMGLVGPSGSGKSTLLHIAGLLDAPTRGEVLIEGVACHNLSDAKLSKLRSEALGFVFQFHHLLPECSVLENVMMPLRIQRAPLAAAKERGMALLDAVGLGDRMHAYSSTLSGGERQRAAIVRALITQPKILLADEPTGNLDEEKAQQIFDIFLKLVRGSNCAALIVTHNDHLLPQMDTVFRMARGKVAEIS